MNRLTSRAVKWAFAVVAVAVLFGACSKDDEAYMSLDTESIFLNTYGQTKTVGFDAEYITSVTISKVPAGWTVEADLAKRVISITSPTELGGESKAVRSGSVTITGYASGTSVRNTLFMTVSTAKELSDVRSNSFIISEPFVEYSFDTGYKGETSEVLPVADVRLIWQTTQGLLLSPEFKDGKFLFYVDGDGDRLKKEGNALVGAYDGNDNLIATWHLWLVDASDVEEQVYANGKTFLSLNLGALGTKNETTEDVLNSFGLFYQWGRRTPFVGPMAYDAAKAEDHVMYTDANRVLTVQYVASAPETGTLAYADANPLSYIFGVESSDYDWLYSTHPNDLWAERKTVNDPCPKGWRVPSERDFEGLEIVDMAAGKEEHYGWNLSDGTATAYYPGAGFRPYLTGRIQNVYNPISGVEVPKPWIGYYWTHGTSASKSSAMFFWFDAADALQSGLEPATEQYRSNGMQIRCVKE